MRMFRINYKSFWKFFDLYFENFIFISYDFINLLKSWKINIDELFFSFILCIFTN